MCSEETEAKEQATQIAKIVTLGNYFGYPECCINAFVADLQSGNSPAARKLDNSGFIPCAECRQKIISNQAAISDLIVNRRSPLEFPKENQRDTDQYLEDTLGNC